MRKRLVERQKLERIDEQFVKELREISAHNHPVSGFAPSTRRLTKAIRRHSLWPKLKQDIMATPLDDDTR